MLLLNNFKVYIMTINIATPSPQKHNYKSIDKYKHLHEH